MVRIVYRRHKESDTWHWCTNCTNWPTSIWGMGRRKSAI